MLLENLNKKQKEAVQKIGGPILVFAGAGSGKTRVLTHKIAYLIEEVGLPPENILAVTFTNKASQEMKSRVVDLVNVNISGINVGTFHSISAQILRKEIKLLGYTNDFTIYDQQDSRSVVKQVIKDLNLDVKQFDAKTYQARISNAKNSLQEPEDVQKIAVSTNDEKFFEIYKKYQEVLKNNNCLDFDDLLILPIKLFEEHPSRLDFYQKKFQYVLVDEYQDTNKPQFEFIYSISNKHKDIFVVGDDDQSIYGWRGADISNILNFQEAFGNATTIKLEQNYRSTKTILEAAWSVVSKNVNRAEKKLWTDNDVGEKIDLLDSLDERIEAKTVLKHIRNSDESLNNIAILYRTNSQSRSIEDELRRGGIAYQIIGGIKFYDRKEIKDILAYAKLIVNNSDSVSFDRVINFPIRGIGKTSIEKIHQASNQNDIRCLDVLRQPNVLNISPKQKTTLKNFYDMIHLFKDRANKEPGSVVMKDLLKELNIKKMYESQMTTESIERWENIEELISSMSEYEDNNKDATLVKYLEEVSLLTDIDNWNDSKEAVTMMTIHSAKGLEFNNVYVCGMEDGLFPIIRLMDDNDIEEERRLFYVALTRAKVKSILSYAKSRRKFGGDPIITSKSRFLREIPVDLINSSSRSFSESSYASNKVSSNNPIFKEDKIIRGSIVEHKMFGKGEVVNIEGVGDNAKLTILFVNNVTKKLIFKYANLKILK